jgi:hypothetical protein
MFKGVGKRRESSDSAGLGVGKGGGEEGTEEELVEGGEEEEGLMVVTDSDGWVYGDNKWEGGSSKGGLGKVLVHFYIIETVLTLLIFRIHTVYTLQTMDACSSPNRNSRDSRSG